ncbi:Interleukin-17F [Bagarius yarrelli]|uniref:Interleukin-17F n=1 Tax=Bagarius yarrelli TaxID=175774 RepID=A0A556VU43_BAGYA|nr:Interleukin-17F [Bagarius yarrelli]
MTIDTFGFLMQQIKVISVCQGKRTPTPHSLSAIKLRGIRAADLEKEIKQAKHSIRPIHNDSISPWEITYTTKPNRIPFQLPEARCLLNGCLNWNGMETMELESRRILWQVPVLQRVSRSGDDKNYYFRLEHETISVGCTCVRPYVTQISLSKP